MLWDSTIIQLFQKGGPVMWPLLVCSVIGLAIVAERLFVYGRMRLNYRSFMDGLLARLRRNDRSGAVAMCDGSRHPVARISRVYLDNVEQADALRQDVLRREGSLQLEFAEKRLRGLSAFAHLAPLLGLLGTVTGLLAGVVQPSDLAGGIWEALLTTVFGLVIGIFCMAAYHAFEHKADEIARRMQFAISELNEFFGKANGDLGMKHAVSTEEQMTAVE
jgi:biopolymer transport protein ExbB